MPNPYGIEQVDVPGLLAAYENQRVRRFAQLAATRQEAREEAEFQRKQGILSVIGRMRPPGSPTTGMGSAYSTPAAPSNVKPDMAPLTAPTLPAGASPAPSGTVTAAPAPGTALAPSPPPETWMSANRGMISQLMTVDAPQAFQLVQHFQTMDAAALKQVQDQMKAIAVASQSLKAVPPAQRAAALQQWVPDLLRLGVPQDQITAAATDLSDAALDRHVAEGRDIEQIIDDTRTKWMPVGEGGAIRVDAYGNPTGADNPYASGYVPPGGGESSGTPPPPASPARGNGTPIPDAASVVRSIYPQARITSTRRDPKSKLGRANPGSYHNSTDAAVDVAPIPGMTYEQYIQGYRDKGYEIIEARDEQRRPLAHTTGPNWHVVLGRKSGGGSPAHVSNDADYAALPSGATFVAPDGSTRRKP